MKSQSLYLIQSRNIYFQKKITVIGVDLESLVYAGGFTNTAKEPATKSGDV